MEDNKMTQVEKIVEHIVIAAAVSHIVVYEPPPEFEISIFELANKLGLPVTTVDEFLSRTEEVAGIPIFRDEATTRVWL